MSAISGSSAPAAPVAPAPAATIRGRAPRREPEMADIAAKKQEWNACLAKSKGAPSRCEKLEKELAQMSKFAGVECCISETVSLMRCTGSGKRSQGCSEEFLAMRECNRSGGRELVKDGTAYGIAPGKAAVFNANAGMLVASTPPVRTLQGMREAGEDYAKSLGIMPGEVRF
mmetsp:Transcript_19537/g.55050  ORF Transcript_19537/g.55050 Transcript_19537/m.55050 type:complete len:172 (+) Transcript_19537:1-516(+)